MGGVRKPVIPLTDEQRRLVEENHDLIYWFMHKKDLSEDWYGDLACALCRAALVWNPAFGSFSTFAHTCFMNEMLKQIKLANAKSRTAMKTVHFSVLRDEHDKFYESEPTLADDPFEMVDSADAVDRCMAQLTRGEKERDAEILRRYVNGAETKELAAKYGISRQGIEYIYKRLGRKAVRYGYDPRTA